MTRSVRSTRAMVRALESSAAIGLSIACMLVAALAIAGASVVLTLLFGTAHGLGALMLAAALSGLFTCAAFATSFAFADARAGAERFQQSYAAQPAGSKVARLSHCWRSRMSFAALALTLLAALARPDLGFAQTATQDAAIGPPIELSPVQRLMIYQSVSRTQNNQPAPPGFRVSVGATLPTTVISAPMPGTLTARLPQTKTFETALMDKQVVVLDPQTRRVAAVIIEGE